MLVRIGMVLQYHQHLLNNNSSSDLHGRTDSAANWDSARADSALLSTQDSDFSEFPPSDDSTHSGDSYAGSVTNVSDDDATSEAGTAHRHRLSTMLAA